MPFKMVDAISFAPLCVQGVSGETQIVYQIVQNVEMVTDVARVLGAEEIQTEGEVSIECSTSVDSEPNDVRENVPETSVEKRPRRSKWKFDPTKHGEEKTFTHRLPGKIVISLDQEQQLKLVPVTSFDAKYKRRFMSLEGQNVIIDIVRSINPFCVFAFKQNRVKAVNSRKLSSPYYLGKLRCSLHDCPVTVKLVVKDETRDSIEIQFEGQVSHFSSETFGLNSPAGRQRQPKRLKSSEESDESQQLEVSFPEDPYIESQQVETRDAISAIHVDSRNEQVYCDPGGAQTADTRAVLGQQNTEVIAAGHCNGEKLCCQLPEKCSAVIPDERKWTLASFAEGKGRRRLAKDGQKTILDAVKTFNPFCMLAVKGNRVKAEKSRKKNCPFFRGKLACRVENCPLKVFITIKDESCPTLDISFKGTVNHHKT